MFQIINGWHINQFFWEKYPNLLVEDLIHDATGQWDRDKVFDLFAHKTRMEILQMPLSRLVWKENRSQSFFVKTAYQVALRMGQQQRVEHSGLMAERKIWRKLWSLNVPPKVRIFVWRACSNVLPTRRYRLSRVGKTFEHALHTNILCMFKCSNVHQPPPKPHLVGMEGSFFQPKSTPAKKREGWSLVGINYSIFLAMWQVFSTWHFCQKAHVIVYILPHVTPTKSHEYFF